MVVDHGDQLVVRHLHLRVLPLTAHALLYQVGEGGEVETERDLHAVRQFHLVPAPAIILQSLHPNHQHGRQRFDLRQHLGVALLLTATPHAPPQSLRRAEVLLASCHLLLGEQHLQRVLQTRRVHHAAVLRVRERHGGDEEGEHVGAVEHAVAGQAAATEQSLSRKQRIDALLLVKGDSRDYGNVGLLLGNQG